MFLFLAVVCYCRIVQVNVVSRHCDRTEVSNIQFPNFPVDARKKLNQTFGKLTLVGLKECYELGKDLRDRYLKSSSPNVIFGINSVYNSIDFKFESTSVQRSMRSLESVGLGLFPAFGGYKLDISPYGYPLPSGIQPIPIHTIQKHNDKFLLGMESDKCPQVWKNYDNYFKTEKGKKVLEDSKPFLDEIMKITGLSDVTFHSFYKLYDHMNVLESHDLLPKELKQIFPKVVNISNVAFSIIFGREVQKTLGGGELVGKILGNMKALIEDSIQDRRSMSTESISPFLGSMNSIIHDYDDPQLRRGVATLEPKFFKYNHFSSHDSTIGCLLSALKLSVDYPKMVYNVEYGSAVIFELHQEHKNFFVKVLFKRGYNGKFESYKLLSLNNQGCDSELCEFLKFEEITKNDAIPSNWCGDCENEVTDSCLHSKIEELRLVQKADTGTITSLAVVCGILLVLTVCFLITIIIMCIMKYGRCKCLRNEKGDSELGELRDLSHTELVDEEDDLIDENGTTTVDTLEEFSKDDASMDLHTSVTTTEAGTASTDIVIDHEDHEFDDRELEEIGELKDD